MASGGQAVPARPFNPTFQHSDRERWICIYPAYINSKKSLAEGRKIPKIKAVDNPLPAEIKEVLLQTGLLLGIENKVYPREVDRNVRGRIRVQLKNDDGTPVAPQFPNRVMRCPVPTIRGAPSAKSPRNKGQALLEFLGETIPKLKTRSQSASSQQQASASSGASGAKKSKGKKK